MQVRHRAYVLATQSGRPEVEQEVLRAVGRALSDALPGDPWQARVVHPAPALPAAHDEGGPPPAAGPIRPLQ